MIRAAFALALGLAGLPGCGGCGQWDLDLERMIEQPRYTSYQACPTCPGGTIMMMPPRGTVPRGERLGPAPLVRGQKAGAYVSRIPTPVTRAMLERGKSRFDIFCAACHGRLGNGASQVAENMTLRRPADLLSAPYTTYPPGRIFTTITEGFGVMRSYAGELPVDDRWAVVAYVQALQLSQHAAVDELPARIQMEARRWLP